MSASSKRRYGLATGAILLLGSLAMPGTTFADGGLVRARTQDGRLAVTLFTSPTPLRVGLADVSVLVQDERGEPVLDADVVLRVDPLDGDASSTVVALARDAATNKLLQAATVRLPASGRFRLTASTLRGADGAVTSADVDVAPPQAALRGLAVPLALPPVAAVLFALHQWLGSRRHARRPRPRVATAELRP